VVPLVGGWVWRLMGSPATHSRWELDETQVHTDSIDVADVGEAEEPTAQDGLCEGCGQSIAEPGAAGGKQSLPKPANEIVQIKIPLFWKRDGRTGSGIGSFSKLSPTHR